MLGRHRGQSVIIYCGSRKATEEMADTLSERGFPAEAYHAGLEAGQRRSIQDRFIRDQTPIVVATIAFGMGINKPDVRLVVHHDLPKSIESYYQETGRAGAGRSTQRMRAVLFLRREIAAGILHQSDGERRGKGTRPPTAGTGYFFL